MSKDEYRILEALCRAGESGIPVSLFAADSADAAALQNLLLRGYAERVPLWSDYNVNHRRKVWRVTGAGSLAANDYRVELLRRHWENIRYAITTAIAGAALVVSIIALVLHTG